jgi:predicted GNAT family acetyltransferase
MLVSKSKIQSIFYITGDADYNYCPIHLYFCQMITLLDNPVWEALSSRQQHFNFGNEEIKYFPADISPFIAMQQWDSAAIQKLIQHIPHGRSFSVMIAKEIILPDTLQIIFSIPLYQMYCPVLNTIVNSGITIKKLHTTDVAQMLQLTQQTKPGPFYEKTILFGNYYGIYHNDQLVSMAGERLKVNGYTEVSAICTAPDHLGNGYASCLTSAVCEQITAAGEIPFLHVRQDNTAAIALYKKLGFQIRANVFFSVFKKK